MNPADTASTPPKRPWFRAPNLFEWIAGVVLLGIAAAVLTPTVCDVPVSVRRNIDATSLRTIGQARASNDKDHPDALNADRVADVYAFAAQLARNGDLNEPKMWFSAVDRGADVGRSLPVSVISPSQNPATAPINPVFQGAPLVFAVALFPAGTHFASLPPTTPLAWTRGLQADGTWRSDAPYPDVGGFVLFADGQVKFFKGSTNGALTKWGAAKDPTGDIMQALPPGTRISEYKPSAKSR